MLVIQRPTVEQLDDGESTRGRFAIGPLEHGFGHTATMHSTNIDHLHEMASRINTSIFVKNGPSFATARLLHAP